MRLFLIKVGKAINVLKRDGFLKGIKRNFNSFCDLFRFVGEGDVLIITGGVGDSARYRAHHVAEELNLNNIKTSVTIQDNPFLKIYSKKFKVFIFHRVLFVSAVEKMIEDIKSQKKEIIFEADDLVYDPKFLKLMDGFREMNLLEKNLYKNGLGGDILNDDYVKVCSTTTIFLAEKFKEKRKQVFILPNKLSKEDVTWAKEILANKKENEKDEIIIGYFSGTISHNKDFATITKPLMRILKKYSQVKLFLAGPLDPEAELVREFGNRIINTPYAPRKEYFKNVALVDINIAPLEIGNPFCEGKSELKFFEPGILKIPTVATATQTFTEAIEDGADGFVAKNDKEWEEKLEQLILDKNLRIEMGKKAHQKTLKKYTTQNAKNTAYYEFLKAKIEK